MPVNPVALPDSLEDALLEWRKARYGGYHVIGDVNISDLASLMTPKKARSADVSNYIVSYVSVYRGGRNYVKERISTFDSDAFFKKRKNDEDED